MTTKTEEQLAEALQEACDEMDAEISARANCELPRRIRRDRDMVQGWRDALAAHEAAKSYCSDERPCIPCFTGVGSCEDTPHTQQPEAQVNGKVACRLYNSGYHAGHHDTVEACYVDIHPSDMSSYHLDVVQKLLSGISDIYVEQTEAQARDAYIRGNSVGVVEGLEAAALYHDGIADFHSRIGATWKENGDYNNGHALLVTTHRKYAHKIRELKTLAIAKQKGKTE